MWLKRILVLWIHLSPFVTIETKLVDPIRSTLNGPIKGVTRHVGTQRILAFLGVSFAQPPIGNLRFKAPQAIEENWTKPRLAQKLAEPCPQIQDEKTKTVIGSEDCLYLNVWTPQLVRCDSHRRPVLIFFHGGGFSKRTGPASLYDGSKLAALGLVVVYTNYRLGILAVFDANSSQYPGNLYLWDQLAAMRWVNANIAHFGGDPSRVTIIGQSAGATSVAIHMFSPVSENLFQNAVIMSGSAADDIFVQDENFSHERSQVLTELFNCTKSTEVETLQCMQNVDFKEFVKNQFHPSIVKATNSFRVYLAIARPPFLLADSKTLLLQSRFKSNISVWYTNVQTEGSTFKYQYERATGQPLVPSEGTTKDKYEAALETIFEYFRHPSCFTSAFTIYFGDLSESDPKNKFSFFDAVSDAFFYCTEDGFADGMTRKNLIYRSDFRYPTRATRCTDDPSLSPCHDDDLKFLFRNGLESVDARRVSGQFMKAVQMFAYSGKTPWKAYEVGQDNKLQKYYHIFDTNQPSNSVSVGLKEKTCEYWRECLLDI